MINKRQSKKRKDIIQWSPVQCEEQTGVLIIASQENVSLSQFHHEKAN